MFIAYKINFTFKAPAFIIKTLHGSGFTFTGNRDKAHKFNSAGEAQDAIEYFTNVEYPTHSDNYYAIGANEELITSPL